MSLRRRTYGLVFAVLLAAFVPIGAQAHSFQTGKLSIGHPWAEPTSTGVAEVYLSLLNMGDKADQLTGATASIARKSTLQELRADKQGTGAVAAIDMPVNRGVSLRPGGNHIRLENLRGPLTAGDKFTLRLTFAEAPAVDVVVFVESHGQQHDR